MSDGEDEGHQEEILELSGPIVRRRCLGKHLAFCHVQDGDRTTQVVFKSKQLQEGQRFPNKASLLPFGANVWLRARKGEDAKKSGEPPCVIEWELQDNPRQAALQNATMENSDGIDYSTYLQERTELFLRYNPKIPTGSPRREQRTPVHQDHSKKKQWKRQPAKIFAQFLVSHFHNLSRVLDIAGGKGLLSLALSQYNVDSIVIDPMVRKKQKTQHMATYFNQSFCEKHPQLLEEVDCLVALHPDEATEHVLDAALKFGKSVAIVPCCVFPSLFPDRKLRNGERVHDYEDFNSYLLEKDERLQTATLPLEGRNQVIYMIQ